MSELLTSMKAVIDGQLIKLVTDSQVILHCHPKAGHCQGTAVALLLYLCS